MELSSFISRKAPPIHDHLGRIFPKGSYRRRIANTPLRLSAAVIENCADWEYHKKAFAMVGWAGEGVSRMCCWLCRASLTQAPYAFDFRSTAAWRRTMFDEADWWDFFQAIETVLESYLANPRRLHHNNAPRLYALLLPWYPTDSIRGES